MLDYFDCIEISIIKGLHFDNRTGWYTEMSDIKYHMYHGQMKRGEIKEGDRIQLAGDDGRWYTVSSVKHINSGKVRILYSSLEDIDISLSSIVGHQKSIDDVVEEKEEKRKGGGFEFL